MEVDTLIAIRVRDLRKACGLTLEQLAERSGVSRSMISLIERQETSPTAAVLDKLADAFGISLPTFFAGADQTITSTPVARLADQPIWTDPASGYLRRHLSPTGTETPIELVEVVFPPGETVVFDNPVRKTSIQQQLWMLEGVMSVSLNNQTWQLSNGDCLVMAVDARITFHNPGAEPARYVLALSTTDHSRRYA